MPIRGMVVRLSEDCRVRAEALRAMSEEPLLVLGEVSGRWVPAVIETDSELENLRMQRWLEAMPGVECLDVVYIQKDYLGSDRGAVGAALGV